MKYKKLSNYKLNDENKVIIDSTGRERLILSDFLKAIKEEIK
jgi:hypothetical protein